MEVQKERFVGVGMAWSVVMGAGMIMLLTFFMSSLSLAQGEGEGNTRTFYLEPVVVTAEKQEAIAQETPLSLTVIDEFMIQDRMIEEVEDIVNFVPNMALVNTGVLGTNVITMRGISASPLTRGTAVAMFIDGVPILSQLGYVSGLLDVERIEVLRGPQGTLYGKSTAVGAVSIVTAKPGNEFHGKIVTDGGMMLSSESGENLLGSLGANINGPIIKDILFFSLAGKMEHKDGFIENVTTGKPEFERNNFFGTGSLRWTPTADLDINLSFTGESRENLGHNANNVGGTDRVVASDLGAKQEVDMDIQSLNIQYNITENIKLTSISARRNSTLDGQIDFDYTNMRLGHGFIDASKVDLSQEFRLSGLHGNLEWLFGVYVDNEELDYQTLQSSIYLPADFVLKTSTEANSYSGFAHLSYNITKDLKIIGGLRYEHQIKRFKSNILAGELEDRWDNVSPKLSIQYNFTPQTMAYATVAQGYIPGGYNDRAVNPTYTTYDPETLWSYELGIKNTFFDNRLMLNAAVFYMDIDSKQVEEWVNIFESYVTNAGKATAVGVELDMTAIIAQGLIFNAGFGYTHAEFTEFEDGMGNYKGNKLPLAPEYTFNAGIQYRAENGFYVGGDVVNYGKTYFDKANDGYRNSYTLVNAKIGYEMENFDVYIYGNNIFNTKYDIHNGIGLQDYYSEPGEIGIQLVARF